MTGLVGRCHHLEGGGRRQGVRAEPKRVNRLRSRTQLILTSWYLPDVPEYRYLARPRRRRTNPNGCYARQHRNIPHAPTAQWTNLSFLPA